ncbi:MAG: antirestriction protein ArdA, partial [Peptococcaceae bacterium]|nr:antirestriction protein ArdA [Peptococcaceae bacterium]
MTIQVYVENAVHPESGGFTLPLPTITEELRFWLEEIETDWSGRGIVVKDITAPSPELANALREVSPGGRGLLTELNYLAAKISGLSAEEREVFGAVLETGRYAQSVAKLINLTENLDRFDLQPAFGEKQYGEFLLDTDGNAHGEAITRLNQSDNVKDRAFAKYIEQLEKHVNKVAYGRDAVKRERGVFTKYGYLTESESHFRRFYHDSEDIPEKYRLFPEPEPAAIANDPLVKVSNTDLAALLMEMHAVGGDYTRNAKGSLQTLFGGAPDYFVLMNKMLISVIPAEELYHRNVVGHTLWQGLQATEEVKTFFFTVTEREGPRVVGSLYELDVAGLQDSLRDGSFDFTHIDAEMKDGAKRTITFEAWQAMDKIERDGIQSWVYHYDPADVTKLNTLIYTLRRVCEKNREAIAADEFLTKLNTAYMARADHPQPDMLRVARKTASDMLARGDADVYRLLPDGPEKLWPIDAVKSDGLWFANYRAFAI